MDSSTWFDTMNMGWFTVRYKGSRLELSYLDKPQAQKIDYNPLLHRLFLDDGIIFCF